MANSQNEKLTSAAKVQKNRRSLHKLTKNNVEHLKTFTAKNELKSEDQIQEATKKKNEALNAKDNLGHNMKIKDY